MKAMRCYSASLRCARPAAAAAAAAGKRSAGETARGSCGNAPPSPFAPQEAFRKEGTGDGDGGTTGGDNPGEMRLGDLLAIAGTDAPGAVLVDEKWQTSR